MALVHCSLQELPVAMMWAFPVWFLTLLFQQGVLATAQVCLRPESAAAIPVEDVRGPRLPNNTQTIITSYQFHCCGDITAWEAAFEPGGNNHRLGGYTVHFQVWRPSPTVASDGCYNLVGENRFTSVTLSNRLMSETPEPSNIISVRPGDVVGYFTITNRNNANEGIQLHEDALTGESLWYNTITAEQSLTFRGESCPYQVGVEPERILRSSTSLGPIVSASMSPYDCPPTNSRPSRNTGLAVGLVIMTLVFLTTFGIIIAVYIFNKKCHQANCTSGANLRGSASRPTTVQVVEPTASNIYSSPTTNRRGVQSREVKQIAGEANQKTADDQQKLANFTADPATGNDMLGPEYADPELDSTPYPDIDMDPTLQYEVVTESVKVHEPDAFILAGRVVPKQSERTGMSDVQSEEDIPMKTPMQFYNKLQFNGNDNMYWTPESTVSELYDQLASEYYREISRDQVTILEHLGSGQFGTVSKGLWTVSKDSIVIAVKQLHPNATTIERVKLLQEAAIMGQFCHPNVVKLHGLVTVTEPLIVCIEFMKNGDLRSYINNLDISKEVSAEIKDVRVFFVKACREVAAGMRYLSRKGFVHRDLAARNVLISKYLVCKIGDFGMARDLMDDDYYTAQRGGLIPVKWTAPEALLYRKYSSDSDVYSYGMVLFEIWSVGKKPFPNMSNQEVIRNTKKGLCQSPPPGCPKAFYKLMVDCWNPGHQHRPKFNEICNYLRQPISKLLSWSHGDSVKRPALELLGSPLENGFSLYPDLQNKYRIDI